jgi:hypothetical protein
LSKSETDQGAVFLGTSLDLLEGDHNRPGDVVKRHARIDINSARKREKEKRDSRHKSKRAQHRGSDTRQSPQEAAQQQLEEKSRRRVFRRQKTLAKFEIARLSHRTSATVCKFTHRSHPGLRSLLSNHPFCALSSTRRSRKSLR